MFYKFIDDHKDEWSCKSNGPDIWHNVRKTQWVGYSTITNKTITDKKQYLAQ